MSITLLLTAALFTGGSDSPTPYTVDTTGITLPQGVTFPANGHVNIKTQNGINTGIHFDPNNNQPGGTWIGKNHIPWTAFNIPSTDCITWVQIADYNEHFGEGGQEPICLTPPETEPPTAPEEPIDPEPQPNPEEPPTGKPDTPEEPPNTGAEPSEEPTDVPLEPVPETPPVSPHGPNPDPNLCNATECATGQEGPPSLEVGSSVTEKAPEEPPLPKPVVEKLPTEELAQTGFKTNATILAVALTLAGGMLVTLRRRSQ